VDEVLVVDGGPGDGTAERAGAAGARVAHQDDLLPGHGPALGRGDALWGGVAATSGDVVAVLDGAAADPDPAHLLGLLGPLLDDDAVRLVRAGFERACPVTELMARPLLNLHVPQLAGFGQPLARETAARRSLLEAIPFPVGDGVEVAILIDALHRAGLDALAEARFGPRDRGHAPLRVLGATAYAVLCAVQRRIGAGPVPAGLVEPWSGGTVRDVPVVERPPLRAVRSPV